MLINLYFFLVVVVVVVAVHVDARRYHQGSLRFSVADAAKVLHLSVGADIWELQRAATLQFRNINANAGRNEENKLLPRRENALCSVHLRRF